MFLNVENESLAKFNLLSCQAQLLFLVFNKTSRQHGRKKKKKKDMAGIVVTGLFILFVVSFLLDELLKLGGRRMCQSWSTTPSLRCPWQPKRKVA